MANKKTKKKTTRKSSVKKRSASPKESDSGFFLKLILYFILGTFWVRFLHVQVGPFEHLSLPLGLLIGVWLASRDKFQIDRKIEYAILLGATFISFYLPVGITI